VTGVRRRSVECRVLPFKHSAVLLPGTQQAWDAQNSLEASPLALPVQEHGGLRVANNSDLGIRVETSGHIREALGRLARPAIRDNRTLPWGPKTKWIYEAGRDSRRKSYAARLCAMLAMMCSPRPISVGAEPVVLTGARVRISISALGPEQRELIKIRSGEAWADALDTQGSVTRVRVAGKDRGCPLLNARVVGRLAQTVAF
jgi:hypothetical protein